MTTVEPIRDLKDLRKVEKFLEKHNKRDLLFFTIGTNCGLRISDILALNIGDIKGKNYIQIIEKKTKKFKKFPINKKLKPLLEDYVKDRNIDEPLFKTVFNNRLERFAAYHIFNHSNPQVTLRYIGIEQDQINESYSNFIQ